MLKQILCIQNFNLKFLIEKSYIIFYIQAFIIKDSLLILRYIMNYICFLLL